jgi:hypothetical protein
VRRGSTLRTYPRPLIVSSIGVRGEAEGDGEEGEVIEDIECQPAFHG